jgi:hypothetical protein
LQAEIFIAQQTIFSDRHVSLGRKLVYRGCVFAQGRSFVVGPVYEPAYGGTCTSTSCDPSLSRLTLAGTTVAFERSATAEANVFGFEGSGEWVVVVRDLRSGRTLHSVPTGTNRPRAGYVGNGPTTALVVKPDGAVAWINNTSQESAHYEVHALDRNGSRVLAVSSAIDGSSLALARSTLYWTENGIPFSAKLN